MKLTSEMPKQIHLVVTKSPMTFYSVPFYSTVPHSMFYILLLKKKFQKEAGYPSESDCPKNPSIALLSHYSTWKKTMKRKKIQHPDWIPGLYITCGPVQSSPWCSPVNSPGFTYTCKTRTNCYSYVYTQGPEYWKPSLLQPHFVAKRHSWTQL